MTTSGVVVGCVVPPAGSTVTPSLSPGATPLASAGWAGPETLTDSRPAERAAPAGVRTHSW